MIVFALGGLVYAPFTPVAYSFLQSGLRTDEQQQVVTLWTTGSMVAAPLGLLVAGPLILWAGTTGGLILSAASRWFGADRRADGPPARDGSGPGIHVINKPIRNQEATAGRRS